MTRNVFTFNKDKEKILKLQLKRLGSYIVTDFVSNFDNAGTRSRDMDYPMHSCIIIQEKNQPVILLIDLNLIFFTCP